MVQPINVLHTHTHAHPLPQSHTAGGTFHLPFDARSKRSLSPLGLRMTELMPGKTFGELALYAPYVAGWLACVR